MLIFICLFVLACNELVQDQTSSSVLRSISSVFKAMLFGLPLTDVTQSLVWDLGSGLHDSCIASLDVFDKCILCVCDQTCVGSYREGKSSSPSLPCQEFLQVFFFCSSYKKNGVTFILFTAIIRIYFYHITICVLFVLLFIFLSFLVFFWNDSICFPFITFFSFVSNLYAPFSIVLAVGLHILT